MKHIELHEFESLCAVSDGEPEGRRPDARVGIPPTMLDSLRDGFDGYCTKRLSPSASKRPEIVLANACDSGSIFRLMQHESSPEDALSELDLTPARDAFNTYVNDGRVNEDDNINRLVFKMRQP